MRLIVGRCKVRSTGRLTAVLPEALRLREVVLQRACQVSVDPRLACGRARL